MLANDTLELLSLPSTLEGSLWRLGIQDRHTGRRMHRHAELEVNLAVSGRAAYLLRDRQSGEVTRRELRRGTLLFLFPEQDHLLIDPNPSFGLWVLVFKPDLVSRVSVDVLQGNALRAATPPEKSSVNLSERETRRLENLFEDVSVECLTTHEERHHPGTPQRGLEYSLLRSWSLVLQSEGPPGARSIHPAVEHAARILFEESEAQSVVELAKRVGLSPSRLSRLFHAQTGETISGFRNRQRLERFHRQENGGQETLLERAISAGFGSYAQFHRVHRTLRGSSPSEHIRSQ